MNFSFYHVYQPSKPKTKVKELTMISNVSSLSCTCVYIACPVTGRYKWVENHFIIGYLAVTQLHK